MLMGQWVKHSFWEEKRRNQAHKEEGKRNFPLLAHPLHSVCPNYPFPFTLEHLPGRLKLGPHVSLSVDTDVRLTFDPDFFVYRYSFPLLILTTSGHFRALIILFNGEVKLIVKIRPGMPSGKAQLQEVGVHATEDQKQIQTSNTSINHSESVQRKFYSCLYRL